MTLEDLTQFMNLFDQGALKPYYKSEPVYNNDDLVQTLVG